MNKIVNFLMLGFSCFLLFSCYNINKNKKEYLTRDWIVNSVELDGVNYGKSIMSLNIFQLKSNNIGSIPWMNCLDTILADKGTLRDIKWRLISPNNDGCYIEIYDSKIDYFNDTFKVVTIDKQNYSVQFLSERVKLNCQGIGTLGIGV